MSVERQLMRRWVQAGGDPSKARLAAAVAMAESSGNDRAVNHNTNGTLDRGAWQINSIHGALSTNDPIGNVRAAIKISRNGQDWSPWVTYNTGAYRKFLKGGGGGGGAAPPITGGAAGGHYDTTTTLGVQETPGDLALGQVLGGLLRRHGHSGLLSNLLETMPSSTVTSKTTRTYVPGTGVGGSGGPGAGVGIRPGGDFAGSTGLVEGAARLAHQLGLSTSSGKRSTVMTASGNVSDHYIGNRTANARDLSGSVRNMDEAAYELARKFGVKGYHRGQPLVATVNYDGYRVQLLYRTNVGGDHFNHVHVGAKKL